MSIKDNTTKLQNLLNQANDLPENKNLETCIITISNIKTNYDLYNYICVAYTKVENGEICSAVYSALNDLKSLTISDVLCGSSLFISGCYNGSPSHDDPTNTIQTVEYGPFYYVFQVPKYESVFNIVLDAEVSEISE